MFNPLALQRTCVRASALLASAAALALCATSSWAADWHYRWGNHPAILPPGHTLQESGTSTCPYDLRPGAPANQAIVGVHADGCWLQLQHSGSAGQLGEGLFSLLVNPVLCFPDRGGWS